MPIYYGGKKLQSLYFGGKKIASAWYGGKVIYRDVVTLLSGPKTNNGVGDYFDVDIPAGTKSIVIKFDKYITSATAVLHGTAISIKNGCIVFPVPTTRSLEEYIDGTVSFDISFGNHRGKNVLEIRSIYRAGHVTRPVTVVGIYAG